MVLEIYICVNYRYFFYDLKSFDALLFAKTNLNRYDLPGDRDPQQFYIQFDLEPPTWGTMHEMFEKYFNLSMTYREDANIQQPYGRILPKNTTMINSVDALIKEFAKNNQHLAKRSQVI